MKYPTNNEIWYAEQRDLAIEERDAAITRAAIAEAEVAALKAQTEASASELEAAGQWRPVSEPPVAAGEYLGWDGYRIQIVQYLPEYEGDAIDWPWWDRYDDEIEVTRWATLLDPPGVMAQERG